MTLDSDFRLDDRIVKPFANSVVGPEGEAHVEPKAMQVLSFLARRPGQVVTKQEILTDVWEGTFVSEEVLPNAIWELRKALGDDAKRPRFIQTLPEKGYRLIAPVASTSPLETAGSGDRGHAASVSPGRRFELARLEWQEGQHGRAIKHYQDFLALWSDADRDLPEIAEARPHLASTS